LYLKTVKLEHCNLFDRFTPERRRKRHPSAWIPFGSGPRSCAGLRFALVQLKMVVAKVVRDFDFQPSVNQTLKLKEGATILPTNGVRLATLRRQSAMNEVGLRRASIMSAFHNEEWAGIRPLECSADKFLAAVRRQSMPDKSRLCNRGVEISRRNSNNDCCSPDKDSITNLMSDSWSSKSFLLECNNKVNLLRKGSMRKASLVDQDIVNKLTKIIGVTQEHPFDNTMGVASMPEDILGKMPRLRCSQTLRRSSAIPELQPVREIDAVDTFTSRKQIHNSEFISNIIDETWFKGTLQDQRLYQRRGSG
jgi:hypothetical protein